MSTHGDRVPDGESAGAPDVASVDVVAGERTLVSTPGAGALDGLLACPVCGSDPLTATASRNTLACSGCASEFPVFDCGRARIPWLFSEPANSRLEWKARYNGFLHGNSLELERLRRARSACQSSSTGRYRINNLLQAREQHRNQVTKILAPLQLETIDWPADAANLLHSKLPRNQGLSSYSSNVFRDWAWDNGENEALLAAVAGVLEAGRRRQLGTVLTLGAGACRLPYDLHRRYAPDLSVALDFNPLLLYVGSRVIQGDTVSLYEFPVAPLNGASCAVLQDCRAPAALHDGTFLYVLADALNPPFVAGSFDTVLTPWLIDIVPQNLRSFVPRINRCLKRGGLWINTGSLAFSHKDESWCYSVEEVFELIEDSGFEVVAAERQPVSYLQSPHSAHGRVEKILSFSAKKVADVDPLSAETYLPDWILDASRPVPASTETAVSSAHHMLTAQVLAAVDGKRTITQIGRLVARQYGLGKRETIHAVRRILIDAWEETCASATDL